LNSFSFFSKKSLKPSWSYSPQGIIWRILVGKRDHIVGECRDNEQKKATFFCLNGISGQPLWENKGMNEPWWVGIEAVHQDVVLVHGFEQPDMPGHRGIEAWKLETGEELWRNEETTYGKLLAFNDSVQLERGMRAEVDKGTPLSVLYRNRDMITGLPTGYRQLDEYADRFAAGLRKIGGRHRLRSEVGGCRLLRPRRSRRGR